MWGWLTVSDLWQQQIICDIPFRACLEASELEKAAKIDNISISRGDSRNIGISSQYFDVESI